MQRGLYFCLLASINGFGLHGTRNGTNDLDQTELIQELLDRVSLLEDNNEVMKNAFDTIEDNDKILEDNDKIMDNDMKIMEDETLKKEVIPLKMAANCDELSRRGETSNGRYMIKPSLKLDSFEVTCNFNGSSAKTVIGHNRNSVYQTAVPLQPGGCSPAGCYNDTITYELEMNQIKALIDISSMCNQAVTHNCSMSSLTDFSWWLDRKGIVRKYWDGAQADGSQGCACSLGAGGCTANAAGVKNNCNCDSQMEYSTDNGVISSLEHLPITEVYYGNAEHRFSWIDYHVGVLECMGQGAVYPSEISDLMDRLSLLENKTEVLEENDVVMQTGMKVMEDDIETLENDVLLRKRDYAFKYYSPPHYDTIANTGSNLVMPTKMRDDSDGAYDVSTGVFKAPEDGLYQFTIYSAYRLTNTSGTTFFKIVLYVDNVIVDVMFNQVKKQTVFDTSELITEIDVKQGQKVFYRVPITNNATYYGTCAGHGCSFIQGKLIKRS